jgi:Chaperone of endosialidase
MALKFRRGTTAQKSGSLAFGEPFVNTTLQTLQIGGDTSDITLAVAGTGSTATFGPISGSGLDITGNANIAGNLTLGGNITIGDAGTDNLVINADLSSSLIPNNDNAFTIGNASNRYSNIYAVTASLSTAIVSGAVLVNSPSQTLGQFVGNQNGYVEFSVRNTSTGISASGDIAVYADNGTVTTNYIDMGINNSGVTQSISYAGAFIGDALDGYLYNVGGDLWIGNASTTAKNIHIFNTGSAKPMISITQDTMYFTGSIISTNGFTGSIASTNGVVSGSSQIVNILAPLNTFSASQEAKDLTIASYTGSNDSKWSTLGSLSGSFARTNSTNTFNGNQTISGSLTVTQDLVILGSSSIQNISSSNIAIGAAYITLNTFSPSSRYAGINFIDSGSAGISGSLLYDSVDDEIVFVHKGNGTNITSSHVVMGPETYDNLGNETYLAQNRIPKVTNYEHIGNSNISDTGTEISLNSLTSVTGSLRVTGGISGSIASTNGVISGSSQVVGSSITTNTVTLNGTSVALGGTATIPNLVSGSSQITLASTTGFGTYINQAVLTTSTPTFGNLTINGTITATGDITAYYTSDKRHKNNIQTISNAVLKVKQLNGVTWEWNDDVNEVTKSTPKTGLIAQEVQAVLPQVVTERNDGFLALDYSKMIGLLVEAIKEQQIQIDQLKTQIGSK